MEDSKKNDASGSEIGYGHPPVNTRFKKGQSGNPKGRPKGSRSFATILDRELRERVVINEGGRRKTVTKLQAAVKQVTNKAASGDPVAARQLFHKDRALCRERGPSVAVIIPVSALAA